MKVGLIAHDSKKKLMQNFCIAYRGILTRHELYATGTTGTLVEEVTNLKIHKFLPGDTEPEVNSVVRLCDIYNIPIATNLATGELLIHALERGELEWRNIG